jgi:hypothetical protein
MISQWDIDHFDDIIAGHGDWFTAQLIRLIHKADQINFQKLFEAYPAECTIYIRWQKGILKEWQTGGTHTSVNQAPSI